MASNPQQFYDAKKFQKSLKNSVNRAFFVSRAFDNSSHKFPLLWQAERPGHGEVQVHGVPLQPQFFHTKNPATAECLVHEKRVHKM